MDIERIDDFDIPSSEIVKITEMGNITEIQYMQKKNNKCMIKMLPDNQYCHVDSGEIFDCQKGEDRSSHKSSLYRTFRNLRNIINTNVVDVSNVAWITLTYAENMTDTKRLYLDFKKFNMRFQYYCKNKGYSKPRYITVVEPQARGAWHHHLLYIWDKKAPFIENAKLSELWGHGFVKITSLKNVDNVGAYLTAYLSDIPLEDDTSEYINCEGIKVVKDDKGNSKAIIKGGRIPLYPIGLNVYRTSREIERPIINYNTYLNAKKKVSSARPTYDKTIKLLDNDFENIISKEYYNKLI